MTRIARLCACLLLCAACAGAPNAIPSLRPIPTQPAGFLASVKLADITPPLHLSLFGHGPESRIATGVRTRLRCEVFVIAAADDIVALVPCDLQSPSMAVQRGVAQRLASYGVPIGADRLFLMATHTHAGPAHYFEARRYSGTFSSTAPGYDQKVVDFLVERISGALVEAFSSLAPACLGWSAQPLEGMTFNRSYVPFLANPPVASAELTPQAALDPVLRAETAERKFQASTVPYAPAPIDPDANASPPAEPPEFDTLARSGPEVAVDPMLSVLKINRRASAALTCKASKPLGVLAVYGMHPTGVPNTNELYHGDIFGFAVRAAEGRLSVTKTDAWHTAWASESAAGVSDADHVIVGIANGVEGDVSPRLVAQSVVAARQHGRRLGHAIAELARATPTTALHATGRLEHLYWDLRFPQGQYDDNPTHRLCESAELGVASGGGAPDGPTRLRILPEANAGYRLEKAAGCHEYKLPLRAGPPSSHDFPQVGPIGLIRVAGGIIATAPGEMTTVTGRRISKAILDRIAEPKPLLAVVGLTNQYMQYFATREEYAFQYYEGASTLYGPNSEAFLVRHFGRLANKLEARRFSSLPQPEVNSPTPFEADPSPLAHRWPADEEPDVRPLAALRVGAPRSRDGAWGWELEFDRLPLVFTADRAKFAVQILSEVDGKEIVVDDDRGASIEVREIEDQRWRVRWIPDLAPDDVRCGRDFRIVVRGRVQLISRPFKLDCAKTRGGR